MFTIIYDKFQFDPIRNEAAKQIGKPLYDFDKDPVEEEYAKAETIYYSKNYNKAIKSLFDIYEKHPKSIYASKSLYTIGYILENDLDKPDSAVSIYTLLQDNFRTSEYAKAIQVKLTGYKQEEIKSKLEEEKANKAISETDNKIPENVEANKIETPPSQPNKVEILGNIESEEEQNQLIEENEDSQKTIENNIEIESPQITKDSSAAPIENKSIDLSKVVPVEKTTEKINFVGVSQDIYKNDKGYYVQVSSWKNKNIAEDEVKKLLDKKYSAFIHETYVESKKAIYYRVKVGPVNSFQAAKNIRFELNKY
jgi:cell division septation protein DedD